MLCSILLYSVCGPLSLIPFFGKAKVISWVFRKPKLIENGFFSPYSSSKLNKHTAFLCLTPNAYKSFQVHAHSKFLPWCVDLDIFNTNLSNKKKNKHFFLATGKDDEEQIILKEILDSDFKNLCVPLDNFSIKETLPIIKSCNLSICNDSSFSHLSAAVGVKTITLMADTPLIYGNYNSKMFPIIPDGEETVSHNTRGKEKINSQKIFKKVIEIID